MPRLLPDDEPLPLGSENAGRQSVERDAASQRGLYPGVQPAPRAGGPFVPGAIQGDPGGQGQPPAGTGTLRGAQSGAGRHGQEARRRYRQFVAEGTGRESVWKNLRQQIYLGDEKFVERLQQQARMQGDELSIPLAQRRTPVPPLATIAVNHANRDDAIVAAYATGACSYREIGEYFSLHLATIGWVIRRRVL